MKVIYAVGLALTCFVSLVNSNPESARRKYAVLSLIGDSLSVVAYSPVTGHIVDPNRHETIPLADANFDHTVLLAASQALQIAEPATEAALLLPSSPTAYLEQRKLLNDQRFYAPEWLDQALKGVSATHLLLFTKLRAEARLQIQGSKVGSGHLEGLGYYVDRYLPLRRSDTGERGVGFLAPYAYFQISLIELSTSTILGRQLVTASTTFSAARNKEGLSPWDSLSASQKVTALDEMIKREVANAVPLLVKSQ